MYIHIYVGHLSTKSGPYHAAFGFPPTAHAPTSSYIIAAIRFRCGCIDFPEVTLCTPSWGLRTVHTV